MIPKASEVVRARYWMAAFMRLLGVVLLLVSFVPLVSWLAEGLRDSDLLSISYYWPRILFGMFFFVLGLIFVVLTGPLTRWLAPVPGEPRCPRCGYVLRFLQRPACPECGLELDAALAPPPLRPIAAQAPPPPAARPAGPTTPPPGDLPTS